MKQFKKAHLAITTGDTGVYIQVKGDMDGLILAWGLLTTHIAKKMKIPLPKMFALCEALRSGVETLHRSAVRPVRSTFPDYVKEMPYDAVLRSLPGCYPLH